LVLRLNQEPTTDFETKPGETVATSFKAKLEKIVATCFEAKPEKTVTTGFEKKKPAKIVWIVFRPNREKPSPPVLKLN
jgi:hypothetical protein